MLPPQRQGSAPPPPSKQTPLIVSFRVKNRCRTASYSSLCSSIRLRLFRQSTTMSDWANDEFMSNWDKTYVSTNLKDGSKAYDAELFKELHSQLAGDEDLRRLSSEILVSLHGMTIGVWRLKDYKTVASCALGRADLAGKWFDDVTKDSNAEESRQIFIRLRESITCVYPFLGVPACMPACYGMIGVLERKGQSYGDTTRLRKRFMDESDVKGGQKLRATIYSTAGNSGIFSLMDKYFSDLCESLLG